jgi:hypothetical protein
MLLRTCSFPKRKVNHLSEAEELLKKLLKRMEDSSEGPDTTSTGFEQAVQQALQGYGYPSDP